MSDAGLPANLIKGDSFFALLDHVRLPCVSEFECFPAHRFLSRPREIQLKILFMNDDVFRDHCNPKKELSDLRGAGQGSHLRCSYFT